jgi:hypothetical protein
LVGAALNEGTLCSAGGRASPAATSALPAAVSVSEPDPDPDPPERNVHTTTEPINTARTTTTAATTIPMTFARRRGPLGGGVNCGGYPKPG